MYFQPNLKPIWLMWSVSSSIFHRRHRKSGGDPCMEKWVMMSFSLAMDFHFLYSSSTFFFRLKRDSWGALFCLKKAWGKRARGKQRLLKDGWRDLAWEESVSVSVHLKWSWEARQCVRGPVMRCEVHNGLEDVFTPRSVDGVRTCEKIYTSRPQVRGCSYCQ